MNNLKKILLTIILMNTLSFGQESLISTLEYTAGSSLYIYKNMSKYELYKDTTRIFYNENIASSPNGRYFSAISSSRGFIGQDEKAYIDHKLLILTVKGKLKHIISDVQRYSWSPDGNQVACILGKEYEGFGFSSWGLKIVNTLDWTEKTFDANFDQDIYWAEFDSMIYTTDFATVYKVDPRSGNKTPTSYKGIYFSPDGSYYFHPNYEGTGFSVYERKTNNDVTPKVWKDSAIYINFNSWLPEGSNLIAGDILREKHIIDISKKRTLNKFDGYMIGYDEKSKEIIVYKDQKHFKELKQSKFLKIKLTQ